MLHFASLLELGSCDPPQIANEEPTRADDRRQRTILGVDRRNADLHVLCRHDTDFLGRVVGYLDGTHKVTFYAPSFDRQLNDAERRVVFTALVEELLARAKAVPNWDTRYVGIYPATDDFNWEWNMRELERLGFRRIRTAYAFSKSLTEVLNGGANASDVVIVEADHDPTIRRLAELRAGLHKASFDGVHRFYHLTASECVDMMKEAAGRDVVQAITHDNEIVGFVQTTRIRRNTPRTTNGWILEICVDPMVRRMHLGATLLGASLLQLRGQGITTALAQIDSANIPSLHLFSGFGFTRADATQYFTYMKRL